jgi:hypothetical protein
MTIPSVVLNSGNKRQQKDNKRNNLAKLDNGLNESPTVMVGDNNKKRQNSVKIGAY